MKQNRLLILLLIVFFTACTGKKNKTDYTLFVNPFVGTDGHGHTFPGAMMPHGMVQLSPDTRTTTWDGCSGYHYSDKSIMGFSHIHYSGVGSGGGADILLMPTIGDIQLSPGDTSNTKSGYRAAFSHDNESATPGYYSVQLEDGIKVELTSTLRVGFHKYTFPETENGNIILDLMHGINDNIDSLFLEKISDTKIAGFRHPYGGLDGNRTMYFYAEFSQPFESYGFYKDENMEKDAIAVSGKNVKAHFTFDTQTGKEVMVKVALSRVDIDGAKNNLQEELPGWNFNETQKQAADAWNDELSRIDVQGGTEAQRKTFYTALYHANIHPNISFDADRRYRSTDKKVYTATDFDNYTTFSLWDTHRALHPLLTIIDQKRTNQYIRTFLERYIHFGNLPIMEFGGNEGFAMIGYHSLPVIADAWVKGIRDYNEEEAFKAMTKLSEGFRDGKEVYKKIGFIPYEEESQSVSRTLEYSYDDWCVSRLAKEMNEDDFNFYSQKGKFYQNLYCAESGFMRPRGSDYQWLTPFDPMEATEHYTEANAYQYSLFVPQDINGLIELMGGNASFEKWLDNCFSIENDPSKMYHSDVTGMIGQYAHGNEPSHHMAYLYNFVGKPRKTQERVWQIMDSFYTDKPDGLCGNEDAGQMSAWYILSAMGFYQVTPGLDYYVLGTPLFDKVTIHFENGKEFIISANNVNLQNKYVQSVSFNGQDYGKSFLKHSDIMQGGEFHFEMGDRPSESWGVNPEDCPRTVDYPAPPMPKVESKEFSFINSTEVVLSCDNSGASIYYTTDGSDPGETSNLYEKPFQINKSSVVKARSFIKGMHPSYPVSVDFEQLTPQPSVSVGKVSSGLSYEYLEGYCVKMEDMKNYPVLKSGIIPTFSIAAIKDDRSFAYRYKGFINVPSDGVYEFFVNSNDGGILYLDGKMLINNDGFHKTQEKWKKTGLAKGFHSVQLDYFQMGGAKALTVSWKIPGKEKEEIPAGVLFH
ncbi:MAG: GH92 family glycosyl hydrolase [Draconibacterium sp.]